MGANQSSQATPKESLYDILGVESNATDSEIKKAYRKQALLLHPDRNFNQEEEATTQFTKVQAAFDVLSDPQERAWYDSHGTTDGSGGGEPEYGGRVTSTDELKKYFDPSWYQKLSNDPEEFYSLIGKLFDQLKQEEDEAALDNGEEAPILPRFGDTKSQWNRDIKPFYDVWSSFSSIKSFAWEDIYRAWDAPDRRTRRAAEQRNKKIREAAKREFNTTVRQLVTVIRQRDPRVKEHNKQKKKSPGNQGSSEQSKRDRKANAERKNNFEQQDWQKVDNSTFENRNMAEDEYDDDDRPIDLFECIVCDKIFKTKKQLSAHESSKKHMKNLAQLKRQMKQEGVDLGIDEGAMGEDGEDDNDDYNESDKEYDDYGINKNVEEKIKEQIDNSNKRTADNDDITTNYNDDTNIENTESTTEAEPVENSDDNDDENVKAEPTLEELMAELEGTRLKNNSPSDDQPDIKVKGKAKQRRQKRQKSTNEFANRCSVCNTEFSSRNKLFQHVKESGHAAPVPRKK